MEDIKREIYEQDAKEAMAEEAYENRMLENGYEKCSRCGCWVEETTEGVCESCIDELIADTTLEQVIEYSEKIDDLYTFVTDYLYNEELVKAILVEEAKKAFEVDKSIFSRDIKEYIENDISDYLSFLKEKGEI